MKTGDHKETAIAIAKEIGLYSENDKVLTGEEIEKMSDLEFGDAVKKVSIFARVTPDMKLRIVKTLQMQGEIVAMTGDGVNDAPALKRADIGVSMGIIGTDVAREASEVVLVDDNFATIVNAIEEGRIVFQNVRQTSFYLITTNVAEQVTILISLLMKMPLPLLPIQILYMNLITDTFNGMAISVEPGHDGVLKESPRNKKERILNKELFPFLILMAGLMVVGTIPLFLYFLPQGIEKARTVAFVSMSLFQMFNIFNMRSLQKSVFNIGLFSNKFLIGTLGISFALMLMIIYLPWISSIFGFSYLTLKEFMIIALITSSILVVGELYKKVRYH
jgi:Ca2+-transporting ATPase